MQVTFNDLPNNFDGLTDPPKVPLENKEKPFNFQVLNQQVAASAPSDFMNQLKSIPYDFLGYSRYTLGYIFMQLFALSFLIGSLVIGAFLFLSSSGTAFKKQFSESGLEYGQFVLDMLDNLNLEFLYSGLLILFILLTVFLFKKKGKVKEFFALSNTGIYLYSKGRLSLVSWDKLEPIVGVYGSNENATIVYTYKLTMAEQIANAMTDMPYSNSNNRSFGSRLAGTGVTIGKTFSVGKGFSAGNTRNVRSKQAPRLLKLYGVKHSNAVVEVSNFYFHQ